MFNSFVSAKNFISTALILRRCFNRGDQVCSTFLILKVVVWRRFIDCLQSLCSAEKTARSQIIWSTFRGMSRARRFGLASQPILWQYMRSCKCSISHYQNNEKRLICKRHTPSSAYCLNSLDLGWHLDLGVEAEIWRDHEGFARLGIAGSDYRQSYASLCLSRLKSKQSWTRPTSLPYHWRQLNEIHKEHTAHAY